MDDSGKSRSQRLWGWVVAVVGLAVIVLYEVLHSAHHPLVVAAGWAFIVYGGMSVRMAGITQRIDRLEAERPTPSVTTIP